MALVSELQELCRGLLLAADRPHGTHKDPDTIMRAEAILGRLESSWEDVYAPVLRDTTEIPALIDQGWEVYYGVTVDEDGWTNPPIFGMVEEPIAVLENRARKRVLIPRDQRTTRA